MLTTRNLLKYVSDWQQARLSEKLFGACPRCCTPDVPRITQPERPFPVVEVDSFTFAICEEHKVRWVIDASPDCLPTNIDGRENARRLLGYEDVTWEVLRAKYDNLVELGDGKGGKLSVRFDDFYPIPDADLLKDFGLEARAKSVIDHLGSDFCCFIERDKETGKLVKIHHKENEAGDWTEEREIVE